MKKIIFFIILLFYNFALSQLFEENVETQLYFYKCKYAKSESVKRVLEQFLSRVGKIAYSENLNLIIVSDTKENIEKIKECIKNLDVYTPQILVEAKIVEVTIDSDTEYEISHLFSGGKEEYAIKSGTGITLKTPGSTPTSDQGMFIFFRPFQDDIVKINSFLRALLTQGKAKILSSPILVVDYGSEASIITGEEVPIQTSNVVAGAITTSTTYKKVGIQLRVTPEQITEDSVRISVNPAVSSVIGYTTPGTTAGATSNPIIATRNTDTVLTVKDGEIITIGGLLRDEERKVQRKIPILGDIPIIGMLFKSERINTVKTQLMFFLKINILKEGKVGEERFFEPTKEKKIEEKIKEMEKK
jgi:type II secretory pathway component GspD/PulD (secretin)